MNSDFALLYGTFLGGMAGFTWAFWAAGCNRDLKVWEARAVVAVTTGLAAGVAWLAKPFAEELALEPDGVPDGAMGWLISIVVLAVVATIFLSWTKSRAAGHLHNVGAQGPGILARVRRAFRRRVDP